MPLANINKILKINLQWICSVCELQSRDRHRMKFRNNAIFRYVADLNFKSFITLLTLQYKQSITIRVADIFRYF